MTRNGFRRCAWVHKWSSLVCTLFLLLLCLTGLPLIFSHEINEAVTAGRDAMAGLPLDAPRVSIDRLISTSLSRFPGHLVANVFLDDDEPHAFVSMVPSFEAVEANPRLRHWLKFDTRTGEVINTSEQFSEDMKARAMLPALTSEFMGIVRRLHVDLYARLPGQLFLGLMGALFVVAIVSGVVLYSPFMKKLQFGTVRASRSRRLRWLDLHNLLGVVLFAWTAVVGLTGVINELAVPLNDFWRAGIKAELGEAAVSAALPDQSQFVSVQRVLNRAQEVMPGMAVISVVFPNPKSISANHFTIGAKGDTPLTGRLFKAALVDVRTGDLTKVLNMPWYLTTLQLSRPLHFGDYGGMPLKIIWALLDIATIIVLGSGLYLWWGRRRSSIKSLEVALAEQRLPLAISQQSEAAE